MFVQNSAKLIIDTFRRYYHSTIFIQISVLFWWKLFVEFSDIQRSMKVFNISSKNWNHIWFLHSFLWWRNLYIACNLHRLRKNFSDKDGEEWEHFIQWIKPYVKGKSRLFWKHMTILFNELIAGDEWRWNLLCNSISI